ncbi:Alpha/Beta hydrolase protein [Suillus ampliporus]|nr:Alpha/Beta hydrolase protein [Suillus ampliporus]
MIGTSFPEYVFILTSIGFLRLVAPISFLYIAYLVAATRWQTSLGGYALLEVLFYTLVYLPRWYLLQKPAVHPTIHTREYRQMLFQRCSSHLATSDYLSGWFFSAEFKRDNVIDWLLWALFSATRDTCLVEWEEELEEYLSMVEDIIGRKLAPGYNARARCMRLTIDSVSMLHRPLVWYLVVGLVDVISSFRLWHQGFHHYDDGAWMASFPMRPCCVISRRSPVVNLPYWYRPHRSSTKLPVLFLHGIGIGLYPYTPFFEDLISLHPDIGILAIEFLSISMRITSPPLSNPATCTAISQILDDLGLDRVVVLSHSYGTVVAAQMLHSHLSPRVAAMLFIDPIPFLLHLPDVAYNFVYRQARSANELQLWYFTSRDPDISRTLSRHFFWSENVLWKEELVGRPVAIWLSGKDQIVNSEQVRKYLTEEQSASEHWATDRLEVLFDPDLDHATVFDTKGRRKRLLNVLDRFVSCLDYRN